MDETQVTEQAQNAPATEDSSVSTSPVAEPTTSTSTEASSEAEQAPVNEPAAEAPKGDVERQTEKPAERRIRALVAENKAYKAQMGNAPLPVLPPTNQPFSEQFQGKESIDPKELDQAADQLAQAAQANSNLQTQYLRQEMQVRDAVNQLEIDSRDVERDAEKFKDILPDNFEEIVSEEWKSRAVKPNPYNPQLTVIDPNVRLKDIAKSYLDTAIAAATKGEARVSASLAQQADNAAMTPGTEARAEKSFADMSMSEQEAYLRSKGHDI